MLTNYLKKNLSTSLSMRLLITYLDQKKTCCMQPINLQQHIINCLIM